MFALNALVRRPSPRIAEIGADPSLAVAQWEAYVGALEAAGWRIHELPAVDDAPAPFVEDAASVYAHLALLNASEADVEKALRNFGFSVGRIDEPARLVGGDVLKFANTVWVGVTERTNDAGALRLADYLAPIGARVVQIPVDGAPSLKSAVTVLPDGTVIGFPGVAPEPFLVFPRFLAVPEPEGAQVVLLGGPRVLISAAAPQSAQMFRELGLDVVEVDISEFERVGATVTRLSIRLRGLPTR